jgi:hypothetical protein
MHVAWLCNYRAELKLHQFAFDVDDREDAAKAGRE